jgi:hypothetical protein
LYEGLLAGNVSIARRGTDDLLWGESEGLFYRLDASQGLGMDVFVSGGCVDAVSALQNFI